MIELNTSVELGLEQALKQLIPYLRGLADPASVWDFLDVFPSDFLYMAGHEAAELPDNAQGFLGFIAGLPDFRVIGSRYPAIPVKLQLETAGVGDKNTRGQALIDHSRRVSAVLRLFSPRYYETLRDVLNTRPEPVLVSDFTPSDVNVAQNRFQLNGHRLVDGDEIRFVLGLGSTSPAPLVVDVSYFVVNAATNMFQVASTQGGSPIVILDSGTGTNEIWKRLPDPRPWSGLGFDAWNAEPPAEGRAPTGNAFIAEPSYIFVVHFETEPIC